MQKATNATKESIEIYKQIKEINDKVATLNGDAAKDASGYVLQNQAENGIGFYEVESTNPKTVKANRAYLNGVKILVK